MRERIGTAPQDAIGVLLDWPNPTVINRPVPLYGWRLYLRAKSVEPWLSMKLVKVVPGPGAANYWLGWNVQRQCFARSSEVMRLPEAMRAFLERCLRNGAPSSDDVPPIWDRATAAALMDELEGAGGKLAALLQ